MSHLNRRRNVSPTVVGGLIVYDIIIEAEWYQMEEADVQLDQWEEWTRIVVNQGLPQMEESEQTVSPDKVELAEKILAIQYTKFAKGFSKFGGILLLFDILFPFEPLLYGLFFILFGSIYHPVTEIHDPVSLSESVFGELSAMERLRAEAKSSVISNVALSSIALGFFIQILSMTNTLPRELLDWNFLQGTVPAWIFAIVVLVVLYIRSR